MIKSSREYRKYIRLGKKNYRDDLIAKRKYAKEMGVDVDNVIIVNLGINDVFSAKPFIPYEWGGSQCTRPPKKPYGPDIYQWG